MPFKRSSKSGDNLRRLELAAGGGALTPRWVFPLVVLASFARADTPSPYYPRSFDTNQALGAINQNLSDITLRNRNRLVPQQANLSCNNSQALIGATTKNGYVYGGSCQYVTISTGSNPTGSAGGDLSGTYPNPTVKSASDSSGFTVNVAETVRSTLTVQGQDSSGYGIKSSFGMSILGNSNIGGSVKISDSLPAATNLDVNGNAQVGNGVQKTTMTVDGKIITTGISLTGTNSSQGLIILSSSTKNGEVSAETVSLYSGSESSFNSTVSTNSGGGWGWGMSWAANRIFQEMKGPTNSWYNGVVEYSQSFSTGGYSPSQLNANVNLGWQSYIGDAWSLETESLNGALGIPICIGIADHTSGDNRCALYVGSRDQNSSVAQIGGMPTGAMMIGKFAQYQSESTLDRRTMMAITVEPPDFPVAVSSTADSHYSCVGGVAADGSTQYRSRWCQHVNETSITGGSSLVLTNKISSSSNWNIGYDSGAVVSPSTAGIINDSGQWMIPQMSVGTGFVAPTSGVEVRTKDIRVFDSDPNFNAGGQSAFIDFTTNLARMGGINGGGSNVDLDIYSGNSPKIRVKGNTGNVLVYPTTVGSGGASDAFISGTNNFVVPTGTVAVTELAFFSQVSPSTNTIGLRAQTSGSGINFYGQDPFLGNNPRVGLTLFQDRAHWGDVGDGSYVAEISIYGEGDSSPNFPFSTLELGWETGFTRYYAAVWQESNFGGLTRSMQLGLADHTTGINRSSMIIIGKKDWGSGPFGSVVMNALAYSSTTAGGESVVDRSDVDILILRSQGFGPGNSTAQSNSPGLSWVATSSGTNVGEIRAYWTSQAISTSTQGGSGWVLKHNTILSTGTFATQFIAGTPDGSGDCGLLCKTTQSTAAYVNDLNQWMLPSLAVGTTSQTPGAGYNLDVIGAVRVSSGLALGNITNGVIAGEISYDQTNSDLNVGNGISTASVHMGEWLTYTPVITASAGSFTTTSSAGRYTKVGKNICLNVNLTITNVGTASGQLSFSLPATSKEFFSLSGVEQSVLGAALQVWANSSASTAKVSTYNNNTVIVNNYVMYISGCYEAS